RRGSTATAAKPCSSAGCCRCSAAWCPCPPVWRRMPLPLFVLFTAGGSAVWNTAFILLGYRLGASWHLVERCAGAFSRAVVLATAVAVIAFVVLRVRRSRVEARRAHRASAHRPAAGDGTTDEDARRR